MEVWGGGGGEVVLLRRRRKGEQGGRLDERFPRARFDCTLLLKLLRSCITIYQLESWTRTWERGEGAESLCQR